MRIEFYGGPLCGITREWSVPPPKGYAVETNKGRQSYLFDGVNRFVFCQTLEGHLIEAYVHDKKRRGMNNT